MVAEKNKKGLKGYYLTTFLIGLGFFTMGLMDPLYDTYVPIFLNKFLDKQSLVGMVMSLDNLLAIFMIPIFSALSDKTRTSIGRRMPYIIILLPLTAIFFFIIPFASLKSLLLLIVCIFFLNIFKQAVRGPVVALMPDIVPADLRSEANGVINTMGGLATILGTILLARLMNVYITLPSGERVKDILAFPVASIFVILAVVLLFFFVKEPKHPVDDIEKEKKEPLWKSMKAIFTEKEKSALYILLSLLCWFIAYQGILPFIGQYSVEVLQTSSGTASLAAGMVGVAYAIFAVPSGRFAHKYGRKKTIRWALIAIVIVLFCVGCHSFAMTHFIEGKPSAIWLYSFWALLFLFGVFWVTIVTNSFPMLWQMADYKTMGIYTGVYYFFSQLAAIIAPTLAGSVIDLAGYTSLFIFGLVFMFVAFFLMKKVNRGEPVDDLAKES